MVKVEYGEKAIAMVTEVTVNQYINTKTEQKFQQAMGLSLSNSSTENLLVAIRAA